MTIKKCTTEKGKSGYKYGDSGKCYSDKKKAEEQRKAIYSSGYKKDKKKK